MKAAVALAAPLLLLAACGSARNTAPAASPSSPSTTATSPSASPSPATVLLVGDFLLGGPNDDAGVTLEWAQTSATSCASAGQFSDIGPGVDVTIEDASGTVVGTAVLTAGVVVPPDHCDFTWTAGMVPVESFYKVTVGTRPAVTFTQAEALAGSLTIGPVNP